MSEVLDWSMAEVLRLVQEYEKRPQLWDKRHERYHSHETKNCSWAEIAEEFSCDSQDIRSKLLSVLASFRRERAKVKKGERSTWFLYPHLRFLPQYFPLPGNSQNTLPTHLKEIEALDTLSNQSDETHVSDADQEMTVTIKQEPISQAFTDEIYTTISTTKKRLTRTINKRLRPRKRNLELLTRTKQPMRVSQRVRSNQIPQSQSCQTQTPSTEMYSKAYVDSKIQELQTTMKQDGLPRKDDCDTYGEYIASTLRKHDNKTRCRIKQAFNNVLFEEEMSKYEDPLENNM